MSKTSSGFVRQMGQAATMGATLAFCIFVGTGLGVLLDRWLKTRPWFTLILMLFGIAAGFYNVVRIASTLGGKEKRP
jgi:ATP synthase protein I